MRERFWELPLPALTRAEWEALCDGCGQCCLHKLEDADTGAIHHTNVACRLLDCGSGQCGNYRHRRALVPDCLRLTAHNVAAQNWLPRTCAYRLRAQGRPLPGWHPLLTGDPDSVRRAGASVAGRVISEIDAGPLEHHLVDADVAAGRARDWTDQLWTDQPWTDQGREGDDRPADDAADRGGATAAGRPA